MTESNWTRAAALALMLAPGLGAAAYADDEYGTGHEAVIRHAATGEMRPIAVLPQPVTADRFAAGQNDNFGAPQRERLIRRSAAYGAVPLVVGVAQAKTLDDYAVDGSYERNDLVGDGGRQDELARSIYRPGSGTDF
jgi:hypothetical protein